MILVLCCLIMWSPVCFAGYLLDGGSGQECWQTDLSTKIQVYLSGGCPATIKTSWVTHGKDKTEVGEVETLVYQLTLSLELASQIVPGTDPITKHKVQARHANFHSCKTSLGACIPNVAKTPGLVTQTDVIYGNFTNGVANFTQDLAIPDAGTWTVVPHIRFLTTTYQYDVAIAWKKTVVPKSSFMTISNSIQSGLIGLSIVFAVACLAILIVIIHQRKRKVIRFSSHVFSMIMSAGCCLGCLGAIPFAFVNDTSCALRPVIVMITYTMIFVPLLLKTYRVFKIFGKKKISKVLIKDRELAIYFIGFLLLDAIIIGLWMAFPSSRPVQTRVQNGNNFEDICFSNNNQTIAVTVIAFKAVLLVIGLLLGYHSRNAPSLFNETTYILNSFGTFVLIVGVGMVMQHIVQGQPDVVFGIRVMTICFSCTMVACQFFLPKFYLLWTVQDDDIIGFDAPTKSDASSKYVSETSSNDDVFLSDEDKEEFLQRGRMPQKLIDLCSLVHQEAESLVNKNQSGYKVNIEDYKGLYEHAETVSGYYKLLVEEPSSKMASRPLSKKAISGYSRSTASSVVHPVAAEGELKVNRDMVTPFVAEEV